MKKIMKIRYFEKIKVFRDNVVEIQIFKIIY